MKQNFEDVASRYLSLGVQNWGQPAGKRKEAEREYIEAAGFRHGSKEGKEWLKGVMLKMKWGKYETEAEQLADALKARAAPVTNGVRT
jgi:hypothetical protein